MGWRRQTSHKRTGICHWEEDLWGNGDWRGGSLVTAACCCCRRTCTVSQQSASSTTTVWYLSSVESTVISGGLSVEKSGKSRFWKMMWCQWDFRKHPEASHNLNDALRPSYRGSALDATVAVAAFIGARSFYEWAHLVCFLLGASLLRKLVWSP